MKKHWIRPATIWILGLSLLLSACGEKPSGIQDPPQTPPALPPPPTDPGPGPASDDLPHAGFYNNADGSPIFAMLQGAKSSIDIEIYQMADADVRKALRNALARRVRIRVVKEPAPLADSCDVFAPLKENESPACADQKKIREEIRSQGGSYVPFNKPKLCANPGKPCFQHGKMIIADGKVALISSGNFNSSNLCNLIQNPAKCNRDFTVIERSTDAVQFLSRVFENDLKSDSYDLQDMILESSPKEKLTISPYSLEPLLQFIQSARTSIRVQNQYLKEPNLNRALVEAAARGVKVEITVASACSFAAPSAREAAALRKLFQPFLEAGSSLRLLPSQFKINGKPGYLHSKAIVIDDARAWVGSVNGSSAATSNNREFGVFLTEPASVSALSAILRADHASPDIETLEESLICKKDRPAGSEQDDPGTED